MVNGIVRGFSKKINLKRQRLTAFLTADRLLFEFPALLNFPLF